MPVKKFTAKLQKVLRARSGLLPVTLLYMFHATVTLIMTSA